MRTTASYELFPDAPSERAMARARYLVREGRVADAEKAYRDVLAEHPDFKTGWAECFELLRSQGRTEDALRLAEGARAQFGDSAFSLALKGAALIELTRYRDAPLRFLRPAPAGRTDPRRALVRRDRHRRARLRRRYGRPRRWEPRRRLRGSGAGFRMAVRPDRRPRARPGGVAHHGRRAEST